MKNKLTIALLLGLNLALVAFAENPAPAPDPAANAPASPAATPAPVADAVAAAPVPTPTTEPAAATPAPATETAAVPPIDAPVIAQADAPKAPAKAAEAPKEAAPGDVLPLILFEDAPLNDAIKTLARQAGINFQFDPKIATPAAGPDGRAPSQATVSIRFENVTAQQALEAVLANHNLQMVQDEKTRTARITVKDPAAPPALVTKVIQLRYTSPQSLATTIKPALTDKRSIINFDVRTSKLIVVATEPELKGVDALVESLDLPTRQVLIEARIYETSKNPSTIKGIDWSGTIGAQNVRFGNNVNGGQGGRYSKTTDVKTNIAGGFLTTVTYGPNQLLTSPGLLVDTARGLNPATAFLDADGVSAVFSFLNSDNETEVVATPRAVTLDNEMALLSVVRAFPIFNVTPGSANSPAGAQTLYSNVGTILQVTPRISADDRVALKVVPEVSNIDGQDQQTVNGALNIANIYAVRKIEANVVVPSGHTLVMGGLISDARTKTSTKVPLLGDAPGIGYLFRRKANDHKKSNLIIFVTPTIVADSDFQTTKTDFLKTKMGDHPEVPQGWWNTTEPHPWTQQQ